MILILIAWSSFSTIRAHVSWTRLFVLVSCHSCVEISCTRIAPELGVVARVLMEAVRGYEFLATSRK